MLYACGKEERPLLAMLLLGGMALRLLWLAHVGGSIAGTYGSAEASRIALAVAKGRGIADAYYPGYGPTAHMMPVSPAIAGFLLWLFEPRTAASNVALLCWCLTQVAIGILLLRLLFQRLGADPTAVRWGTAMLCLVTPFITQETIDFRYWEGASALCLGVANLLFMSGVEEQPRPRLTLLALISALEAATLFVSPPVGLATGACWAVLALRQFDFRRCVQLAGLAAAAVIVVFTPWALRNAHAFGEPVLARSNFGLELAIANHSAALSAERPEIVHARRLAAIHPFQASAKPPLVVKPGGEVAYSHRLAAETFHWIATNPGSFAVLYARHLREFFFPDPWELYFSGWAGMAGPRAVIMSLVDLLGLVGLAIGLRRSRRYWSVGVFIIALALPYGLFEPTTTHMYPAYSLCAFVAVEAVTIALRRLKAAGQMLSGELRGHVKQPQVG